jgi:large subunit ribosomal protein L10
MSKYVKNLIGENLKSRLEGVNDLLVVNVVGMTANSTAALRKQLREKNIHLVVVKNSLIRRATEGTVLAPAFEGAAGTMAVVWGGEDIVSLSKEISKLATPGPLGVAKIQARGGAMDGAALSADDVAKVAKWPSRREQLSILVGQILSPGGRLQSQLRAPGGRLASQIEKKGKEADATAESAAVAESAAIAESAVAESAVAGAPDPEAPSPAASE